MSQTNRNVTNELWQAFQKLMGKPQVNAGPVGYQNGNTTPPNPLGSEFLGNMKKYGFQNEFQQQLRPTPVPQVDVNQFQMKNPNTSLPPGSYAEAIQNMVRSLQRR